MKGIFLVSVFWVVFFTLHSLLAADVVKRRFNPQMYRLFYNGQSTVFLLFILFYMSTTESALLFQPSAITNFIALALAAYGVIVVRLSFREYSIGSFLGLKKEVEDVEFKKDGLLSKVRHPLYSGTLLVCVGFVLFIPNVINLISVAWVFLYLPVGIWLEEGKLITKYGKAYEDYRSQVPSIIPRISLFRLFKKAS